VYTEWQNVPDCSTAGRIADNINSLPALYDALTSRPVTHRKREDMTRTLQPATETDSPFLLDRLLIVPKAYYFLHFGAMACVAPFLVLYYREVGLSGTQIGLLTGLAPIVTWLAAPLWGALADARQRHRAMLLTAITGAIITVLILARTTSLLWLVPVVAAYAFFGAPIIPLVDNSVMSLLGARGDRYGRQRMWGAVGWGLTGAVAGVVVERYGLPAGFGGYALLMGIGLFVASRLQVRGGQLGQPFWLGLRTLIRNRPLVVFLLTVFVAGMGTSLVHSYLFLYLRDMGASETLMGLSLTVATVSEVPVFFVSGWLIKRLGARGLMMVSLATLVVRLAAYSVMPWAWMVLPIHLLHGLTFSAMWVAGVSYANEVAPPGLGATAQGLFSGMAMGLGAAAGALLGGLLYDSLGGAQMYLIGAGWVAVGLVMFLVAGRRQASECVPS